MHWILATLIVDAISFGIAFAAALVLREVLARPWRRSVGEPWTERARLAYAPGMALLWLGPALGFVLGILGDAIVLSLTHKQATSPPVLLTTFAAAMAGALVVRYKWLCELWGLRVTFRSWLAGALVVLLGIAPGLLMTLVLILLLPDTINAQAVITFIAAILVVGLFALGGNLKLLGWIGIMKPAPPVLTAVVDQLAQLMNVQGKVRASVLEWAMVNAVAWQRNRAIGFSRALLEVMTNNEVRAVAAHELAHLVEPLWVRRIRTAHVFVYLPLVPAAKYGGLLGLLIAFVLGAFFFFGYVRFTHHFEKRADRAESGAIADTAAYAMSLTTLHQANAVPAVMPGKQTHPHLYDRLLAGGVQPDFPRPRPPSRAKPMLAVLATTLAVILLVFAMLVGFFVTLKLLGYEVRWGTNGTKERAHD